jgi:hypothetical protein
MWTASPMIIFSTPQPQTQDNAAHVGAQAITISIQGTRITDWYEDEIREHIDGSYLRHYLSVKHKWTDSTWAWIDWYCHERHLKVLKGTCLFQRLKFIHDWQPINSKSSSSRSPTMPRSFCSYRKTTLENHDHVLLCPSQGRTRYLALQDIRGTISEARSPAGPILWEGLTHWLSNSSEPLSIKTSRYSGRTKLLVQQALHEQERIG